MIAGLSEWMVESVTGTRLIVGTPEQEARREAWHDVIAGQGATAGRSDPPAVRIAL